MTLPGFAHRTLMASVIALHFAACDTGSGGGQEGDDTTESQPDAALAADADTADPADAAAPSSCSALEREECVADGTCAPICTSACDCDCPSPSPSGDCGCEGCPPDCFTYDGCEPVPAATQCGELDCDPDTEVCVVNKALTQELSCVPLPDGCEEDRSCDCLADDVCQDPFDLCTDAPEVNTVSCECTTC